MFVFSIVVGIQLVFNKNQVFEQIVVELKGLFRIWYVMWRKFQNQGVGWMKMVGSCCKKQGVWFQVVVVGKMRGEKLGLFLRSCQVFVGLFQIQGETQRVFLVNVVVFYNFVSFVVDVGLIEYWDYISLNILIYESRG